MINTYSPWEELAALPRIDLVWQPLADTTGEYRHWRQEIALDPRMRRHQARSVLCHEIRRAVACAILTDCSRSNLRPEQRADRDAARLLVDVDDPRRGGRGPRRASRDDGARARCLGARVRVRLANLHPSELHYLRGRPAIA